MTQDRSTEGLEQAPRSPVRRRVRRVVSSVVFAVVVVALFVIVGKLPPGTAMGSLVARAAVGVSIGVVLTVVVGRMLRALGEAPPSPPATVDARASDIVYECPVCGTTLRLEVAATAKAPKHCGEEMEPRLSH